MRLLGVSEFTGTFLLNEPVLSGFQKYFRGFLEDFMKLYSKHQVWAFVIGAVVITAGAFASTLYIKKNYGRKRVCTGGYGRICRNSP